MQLHISQLDVHPGFYPKQSDDKQKKAPDLLGPHIPCIVAVQVEPMSDKARQMRFGMRCTFASTRRHLLQKDQQLPECVSGMAKKQFTRGRNIAVK